MIMIIKQERLFASFQVTDAQQNRYSSELASLQNAGRSETVVAYDDMGLLKVNTFDVSAAADGSLTISAEIESLQDKEVSVRLDNGFCGSIWLG